MPIRKNHNINFEQLALSQFLKYVKRSNAQVNNLHEADCEIIKLNSNSFLATSIDSFAEEYNIGLFKNVETLARLCVHGTLSDLVVSGSKPLGFLFSPLWNFKITQEEKNKIFKTIISELNKLGVFLLGGDEGQSTSLSLTGVVIGHNNKKPKTRLGIKTGDYLCLLGQFGIGPALGIQFLLGKSGFVTEDQYNPRAQIAAISAINQYVHASIDTSDGLCNALHYLAELNEVRFLLEPQHVKIEAQALAFCRANELPSLCLWFGEVGDYQPLLVVKPENYTKLKQKLPSLIKIGEVRSKQHKDHILRWNGKFKTFEPGKFSCYNRSSVTETRVVFDNMISYLELEELVDV